MEDLILEQAALISDLRDEVTAVHALCDERTAQRDEAQRDEIETAKRLRKSEEKVEELQTEVANLKSEAEDAEDDLEDARKLQDLAEDLLQILTGSRRPSLADCAGFETAWRLSVHLDEHGL